MSYEKLGFTSGQTLKAEHLNHMEDGIEAVASGLSIKKIAFTDRPSLWEWLQSNWDNAFRCKITLADGSVITNLSVATLFHDTGEISYVQFHDVMLNASYMGTDYFAHTINITNYNTTMDTKTNIRVNKADGTVIGEGSTDYAEIPDEYWSAMGTEVTIYYFDE